MRHGYFVDSPLAAYANIDEIAPLALLTLEAALRGKRELVPEFIGSNGFIHGEYLSDRGEVRNIVDKTLFTGRNSVGTVK